MYLMALLITIVDLLVSCFHMPIFIVVSEFGTAATGTTICVIHAISTKCVLGLTFLSQGAYNIDRFLAIRWPLIHLVKVTKFRILLAWMTSAGVILVVKISTTVFTNIEYQPLYDMCLTYVVQEAYGNTRLRYLFEIFITVFGYSTIFYTSYKVSVISL